ncbi:helix-turn-helix transcriptional regulator [Yinghuangia seranimata]|uniref:helix-turn-helix transcriptional regulator n=1 Tax=Yinghuangia seranimata TaxID=408067 RepID=UPI00248B526F|nr:helix-turn-helix transcriptional regulator [Yinghuangia seranimata]MDI2131270.1 helix-turn-helix transcriptional regulator [Yinghuangia seranimata]
MNADTRAASAPVGRVGENAAAARRSELASFLRSRRERIDPRDVGLPPGIRRRTPGLRREEVAQLAGIGVAWYTWLEQARPINVSVQVLASVARTLRLDATETEHLYRLADVSMVQALAGGAQLAPEVHDILDALVPLPAAALNDLSDVLAWNRAFALLFPFVVDAPADQRNLLWQSFMLPRCCGPFVNRREELGRMVAGFRSRYGRHVGEPAWDEFVSRLAAASPEFGELWAEQAVIDHIAWKRVFRHCGLGELTCASTTLDVAAAPGAHLMVLSPGDDATREKFELLRGDTVPVGTCACGDSGNAPPRSDAT